MIANKILSQKYSFILYYNEFCEGFSPKEQRAKHSQPVLPCTCVCWGRDPGSRQVTCFSSLISGANRAVFSKGKRADVYGTDTICLQHSLGFILISLNPLEQMDRYCSHVTEKGLRGSERFVNCKRRLRKGAQVGKP